MKERKEFVFQVRSPEYRKVCLWRGTVAGRINEEKLRMEEGMVERRTGLLLMQGKKKRERQREREQINS